MTSGAWPVETLRSLPLLCELSEAELTTLLSTIERRSAPAQSSILRAGETPDGLYILVSGRVRLVHEDQQGHRLIAEVFGPGELFGEMGLIDATACPASVVAVEHSEAVFIRREAAVEWLETTPRAAMSLLRISLQRLCKAHQQLGTFALTKVDTRVAQVLVANGHDAYGEWHVDVGSEQIAAMVGASREMVSKVLRGMIKQGLVRRYKRRLIVIDREALRAYPAQA